MGLSFKSLVTVASGCGVLYVAMKKGIGVEGLLQQNGIYSDAGCTEVVSLIRIYEVLFIYTDELGGVEAETTGKWTLLGQDFLGTNVNPVL